MKITVICGSPNDFKSITYHHLLFLDKNFNNHDFEYLFLNEEGKISNVEDIFETLMLADLIIFAYPVHTMLVPYRMMLFMKSLLNDPRSIGLIGKNACQYSTSNHFFDMTASKYMKACFETLKMNTLPGYMAKSEDVLNQGSRQNIVKYFEQMLYRLDTRNFESKVFSENREVLYPFVYEPHLTDHKDKSFVTVVYNGQTYSENLKNMILAFDNLMPNQIQLIDLSNISLQSSTMKARLKNIAFSRAEKSDFLMGFEEKLSQSKVIIYASDVENHWFNDKFKILEDCTFSKNSKNQGSEQALGFIFAGSIKTERALLEYMDIKSQTSFDAYLGFISNESPDIRLSIESMIQRVCHYIKNPYKSSKNFYYHSSSSLFNDRNKDIWTRHLLMKHQFFLKILRILSKVVSEDKLLEVIENQILKPYKKVIKSQSNIKEM